MDLLQENENESFSPMTFMVNGHYVHLSNPVNAKLAINVPWDRHCEMDEDQRKFVIRTSEVIIRYMISEGIVGGNGIGFQVILKYPQS